MAKRRGSQHGFTLVELMIVIAIIAILSSIGVPAYQGYLQKAAMTDMLQTLVPYKTAVDLCAMESSSVTACNAGSQGIPSGKNARYVSDVNVVQGVITLTGEGALQGLRVIMTPNWDSSAGKVNWLRNCQSAAPADSIVAACQDVFRFDNPGE